MYTLLCLPGAGRVRDAWDVVSKLLPNGEVRGHLPEIIPCKTEFTYLCSQSVAGPLCVIERRREVSGRVVR